MADDNLTEAWKQEYDALGHILPSVWTQKLMNAYVLPELHFIIWYKTSWHGSAHIQNESSV